MTMKDELVLFLEYVPSRLVLILLGVPANGTSKVIEGGGGAFKPV
jgi:hypothetical protein